MRMIIALATAALLGGTGTAYHSCDGSTTMTSSGRTVQVGYVANNSLPIGTWIEMRRPKTVMGRKYFRVMDRGGASFALDFWAESCEWMNSWGSRQVTFKALARRDLYRGLPVGGWRFKLSNGRQKLVWRPK